MSFFALSFASPLLLLGLLALPLIWWLLKLTPPRPQEENFPPTRILQDIPQKQETPAQTPWWLILLRLLMAAALIIALAEPLWNSAKNSFNNKGPLLLILDDGWTSGDNWLDRKGVALELITQAQEAGRPVTFVLTSQGNKADLASTQALTAQNKLIAAQPHSIPVDLSGLAEKLNAYRAQNTAPKFTSIAWLASGLNDQGAKALNQTIAAFKEAERRYWHPKNAGFAVISHVQNTSKMLSVHMERSQSQAPFVGELTAYDIKGRSISSARIAFAQGAKKSQADFTIPVELRNDITRIALKGGTTSGHVHLLDERFRRRKVGLISGNQADQAQQPLLSPLYYIARALEPFSDVREARQGPINKSIAQLLDAQISTLILADIGTIPKRSQSQLQEWIEQGGMLVRFAGPRLAGSDDESLIPTPLRRGDRNLGGTLSWGTPQPLTSFTKNSPFDGIAIPNDVTVSRQILAQPDSTLQDKTWASLKDGTPLVTARKQGQGWLVLFHVTADSNWSNLPLSGTFVDMLRRLVAASNGALAAEQIQGGTAAKAGSKETGQAPLDQALSMPPLQILNGYGQLSPPPQNVQPLLLNGKEKPLSSLANPPGTYGQKDAFFALNLFNGPVNLQLFNTKLLPIGTAVQTYALAPTTRLKPWLLAFAMILFTLDCWLVLKMAGAFRRLTSHAIKSPLSLLFFALLCLTPLDESKAQSSEFDIALSLKTHLAYVKTGDEKVDKIARQGLTGLTRFLSTRTSLEPGPPVGVDISRDELAYFPLLYWPISTLGFTPDAAAMARVDEFMKNGGSILFDTRDQFSNGFNGNQTSGEVQKLRQILKGLNIPPLEPVPANHVLTRSFYLLNNFPGRYLNGKLWVAASRNNKGDTNSRLTRIGDGVSPIMITSNDFAAAWATGPNGQFVLPTVPPNPQQRQYAFRTGVNIVMYTLTGNYKSDQVHIPDLLERLNQ